MGDTFAPSPERSRVARWDESFYDRGYVFDGEPAQPWLEGWARRTSLTIDPYWIASDLDGFPLLVSVGLPTALYSELQSDGADLRVTMGDGVTRCYHELATFDPMSETLQLWVRAPRVAADVPTRLYLYWGNAAALAPPAYWAAYVWRTNGYQGVWHLDEATGDLLDSTSYALNGTNSGADYGATGQIGNALGFVAASSDYVGIPTIASNQFVTIEAWFKTTATSGVIVSHGGSWSSGDIDWILQMSSSKVSFWVYRYVAAVSATSPLNYNDGAWHHVVGVIAGAGASQTKLYIDGAQVQTASANGFQAGKSDVLQLGVRPGRAATFFNGTIDEVRLSSVARSADWIAATYNNERGAEGLYRVGAVERQTT